MSGRNHVRAGNSVRQIQYALLYALQAISRTRATGRDAIGRASCTAPRIYRLPPSPRSASGRVRRGSRSGVETADLSRLEGSFAASGGIYAPSRALPENWRLRRPALVMWPGLKVRPGIKWLLARSLHSPCGDQNINRPLGREFSASSIGAFAAWRKAYLWSCLLGDGGCGGEKKNLRESERSACSQSALRCRLKAMVPTTACWAGSTSGSGTRRRKLTQSLRRVRVS